MRRVTAGSSAVRCAHWSHRRARTAGIEPNGTRVPWIMFGGTATVGDDVGFRLRETQRRRQWKRRRRQWKRRRRAVEETAEADASPAHRHMRSWYKRLTVYAKRTSTRGSNDVSFYVPATITVRLIIRHRRKRHRRKHSGSLKRARVCTRRMQIKYRFRLSIKIVLVFQTINDAVFCNCFLRRGFFNFKDVFVFEQ